MAGANPAFREAVSHSEWILQLVGEIRIPKWQKSDEFVRKITQRVVGDGNQWFRDDRSASLFLRTLLISILGNAKVVTAKLIIPNVTAEIV